MLSLRAKVCNGVITRTAMFFEKEPGLFLVTWVHIGMMVCVLWAELSDVLQVGLQVCSLHGPA